MGLCISQITKRGNFGELQAYAKNVKLRVKRKAVLSDKVFWLYIACTLYAAIPSGFIFTTQRDFRRLKTNLL